MSATNDASRRTCVSCGIEVSGTSAARFPCPSCDQVIFRCRRCRKQSTRYSCPTCSFQGP